MPFFLCVSCVCAVLLFIGIVIIFFLIFVVRFVVCHVIFAPYSYCGVAVLYGEGLLVAKKVIGSFCCSFCSTN